MVISLLPAVKKSAPRGFIPARVLVVDPEPLIRWSISVALTAAGFDADSAATAEEARQLAAAGAPLRVVLLDVHPDRQPQPLIEEIRAICPDCRFVVMSTARQRHEVPRPVAEVHVIEKPFDLATLVAVVTERAGEPPRAAGDRR